MAKGGGGPTRAVGQRAGARPLPASAARPSRSAALATKPSLGKRGRSPEKPVRDPAAKRAKAGAGGGKAGAAAPSRKSAADLSLQGMIPKDVLKQLTVRDFFKSAKTSARPEGKAAAVAAGPTRRSATAPAQAAPAPAALLPPPPPPPPPKGRRRQHYTSVKLDGQLLRCGDSVYVITREADTNIDETDESDELCEVCGGPPADEHTPSGSRGAASCAQVMLECEGCLLGYHLGCLTPPLEAVPPGQWLCPACAAGAPPPAAGGAGGACGTGGPAGGAGAGGGAAGRRRHRTARERFLAGELSMARIESIWKEVSTGDYWFTARWYYRPEETHTGRQAHHARREVFLTSSTDDNEMASVLRACRPLMPVPFAGAGDAGDDVYLCEYQYDVAWQRFRRRGEGEEDEWSDEEEEGEDAGGTAGGGGGGGVGRGGRRRGGGGGGGGGALVDDDDYEAEALAEARERFRPRRGAGRAPSRGANVRPRPAGAAAADAALLDGEAEFETMGRRQNIQGLGALAVPASARQQPATAVGRARAALTLAALPRSLPCRERERAEVAQFVEEAVAAGTSCQGRCLYISGVPGTGKTATVKEVMRGLQRRAAAGELPPFRFVEINGLKLLSPAHAYSTLYEAVAGERLSPARAGEALEARFCAPAPPAGPGGARVTVVLVDEIDLLVTRTQSVLYNLFDWPTRKHARLVVLAVANTMDLPERLLPKIGSRLGLRRVTFAPYTQVQLQAIVKARLSGLEAFKDAAIEFAARKVAAVSGDARRALELCRRAAEIAEGRATEAAAAAAQAEEAGAAGPSSGAAATATTTAAAAAATKHQVEIADISAAVQEMLGGAHASLVAGASRQERMLLAAVLLETRRTGSAEATLELVADFHARLARTHGEPELPEAELAAAAARLAAGRLLLAEPGRRRRHQKLALNLPPDDLVYFLKHDHEIAWLRELAL